LALIGSEWLGMKAFWLKIWSQLQYFCGFTRQVQHENLLIKMKSDVEKRLAFYSGLPDFNSIKQPSPLSAGNYGLIRPNRPFHH